MKIMMKVCLSIYVFITASTLFAAPDLAELQAMYPVTDKQEWNYHVEVIGAKGGRRECFQDGQWGFIDQEHKASHLKRNQWFPVDEEKEKERAIQVTFLGNLLRDLSDLFVLDESEEEVVYGIHTVALNDGAEENISVPSQSRFYYDQDSNHITRLITESTESISLYQFKILSIQYEVHFSDGSDNIPKGFSREHYSLMNGTTDRGEKIEQKELHRYSDFTLSNMEMTPVKANGCIGNGAAPTPNPN